MEMPCRTKIGIAGCRNACGGVYSKDVGVISDVNGLLMVVAGGSAGFHPRIADIVVRDLTEDEALVVIEQLFAYYQDGAQPGGKLGDFINRTGLKALQKACQ